MKRLTPVEVIDRATRYDGSTDAIIEALADNGYTFADWPDVQPGDTWEVRDGRAVVVASNRWPPPKPGEHALDVVAACPCGYDGRTSVLPGQSWRKHVEEALGAIAWSRAGGRPS